MPVVLRTAVPADREAVVDLIQALNRHESALTGDRRRDRGAAATYYDDLMQRLARRDGRIVLAADDATAVGAMGFCIDEDAAYVTADVRRHGTVTDLVVDEAWRGRGIGRLLLAEAERLTRAAGCRRLTIGVLAANDGADRLYRNFGFESYVSVLVKAV